VPRYFFDLVRQKKVMADREGVEIPDYDLEEEITRIMEEMRCEEPELFDGRGDWSIEVIDEQGRRVARFSL